jgi:hypothetical protein
MINLDYLFIIYLLIYLCTYLNQPIYLVCHVIYSMIEMSHIEIGINITLPCNKPHHSWCMTQINQIKVNNNTTLAMIKTSDQCFSTH